MRGKIPTDVKSEKIHEEQEADRLAPTIFPCAMEYTTTQQYSSRRCPNLAYANMELVCLN